MRSIWKLPGPSSALTRGVRLEEHPRRVRSLSFAVENDEGMQVDCAVRFDGVVSFRCTFEPVLSVDMTGPAYDTLVEVEASAWRDAARAVARRRGADDSFKHYMICFDDGPCYEFLARGGLIEEFVRPDAAGASRSRPIAF